LWKVLNEKKKPLITSSYEVHCMGACTAKGSLPVVALSPREGLVNCCLSLCLWVSKEKQKRDVLRPRKLDIGLPGKGNSSSHGARPVHRIISLIEWIRTSRLSIKNALPLGIEERGEEARRAPPDQAFDGDNLKTFRQLSRKAKARIQP